MAPEIGDGEHAEPVTKPCRACGEAMHLAEVGEWRVWVCPSGHQEPVTRINREGWP